MIGILIGISLISLLVLSAFGVVSYDDGVKLNVHLFDSFIKAWYGWIIVILFQILFTSLLSMIPGISMAFILLLKSMYSTAAEAFFVALLGVILTSVFLYLLGRFGGYAICKKLLGKEDCEKALALMNKGSIFFPVMMLFPIFPDDALVMVAGTMRMKLSWFIPSIVLGRGIGVATIVFGLALVPFDKFTSIWHWILFILLCAVFIVLVFFFAYRFNKYINNKKKVSEKASLVMRISAEEVIKANEAIEESMENPSEEKE
jgi:uncharacterized membrane protein YdjX (TVP38/TMEM64 family)